MKCVEREEPPLKGLELRELNDGKRLPAVGFGTYPHQGEDSAQTVEYAISIGYRLFDTALSYGNERGVGEGIRRSGVPRDEIIVTSKLPGRYHGLTEARTSVSESLEESRRGSHRPLPHPLAVATAGSFRGYMEGAG
jgi:diketogulonate reductase-like aldo/keto reductase